MKDDDGRRDQALFWFLSVRPLIKIFKFKLHWYVIMYKCVSALDFKNICQKICITCHFSTRLRQGNSIYILTIIFCIWVCPETTSNLLNMAETLLSKTLHVRTTGFKPSLHVLSIVVWVNKIIIFQCFHVSIIPWWCQVNCITGVDIIMEASRRYL